VYKDVSENYSYNKFKRLQSRGSSDGGGGSGSGSSGSGSSGGGRGSGGMHCSPTLLAGTLDSGSQFMLGKCSVFVVM